MRSPLWGCSQWGTGDEDLYLVGKRHDGGMVARYDGQTFHLLDLPVIDPLYAVHGNDRGEVYAVGGTDSNAGTSCVILHAEI